MWSYILGVTPTRQYHVSVASSFLSTLTPPYFFAAGHADSRGARAFDDVGAAGHHAEASWAADDEALQGGRGLSQVLPGDGTTGGGVHRRFARDNRKWPPPSQHQFSPVPAHL